MKTIGEVITILENIKGDPESVEVFYSFGYLVPTIVDSWRGVYAEPALGHKDVGRSGNRAPTVASLLKALKESISGQRFHGWKGGEYVYTKDSPLHIDNAGEYSNTEIVRIEDREYDVIIHTEKTRL